MLQQLTITLRLHFRNKIALVYSYLFPTIFLVAFWVLYRYEQVPLARHMGELLTVTVLGGACFGLPTTMVSERERGVWRRYRLAPVATGSVVASTVIARYVLLILAGLLQVALAMAIGMPLPRHPLDLWLAFTCVAFAFLGLGLVIAMMADNVPAVQALGQCIFLPMLIIGGVAVQLASLPAWAQHVSAFFPGRYAVEALQVSVTGSGLSAARFSVLALLLIGAAGCVAGARMFRWDAQQRFAASHGKGWVAVALAAWAAVGLLAESRGRIGVPSSDDRGARTAVATPAPPAPSSGGGPAAALPSAAPAPQTTVPPPGITPAPGVAPEAPSAVSQGKPSVSTPLASTPGETPNKPEASPAATAGPPSWQAVTREEIDRNVIFERLPPDAGVVAPIARADEEREPDVALQLDHISRMLPQWAPGKVQDPVQRVRNFLYVAAVPDVFQMDPLERFLPQVVFDRLEEDIPAEQLIKVLYWIATHPAEGDDSAVDELRVLRLGNGPNDIGQTRERVAIYAVKLLGRLMGRIPR